MEVVLGLALFLHAPFLGVGWNALHSVQLAWGAVYIVEYVAARQQQYIMVHVE